MIEEHVLDRHEGAVFDHVFHDKGGAAELGAISACHHEIFAIRLRLGHAADGLHDQIVAFPAFAGETSSAGIMAARSWTP